MPNPPRTATHAGRTLTLEQWAREAGLPLSTLRSRLDKLGQDFATAISTPARAKFNPRKAARDTAPRPVPPLKEHANGQGYADWSDHAGRHQRYFGRWGSAECNREYARFAAEWAAAGGIVTDPGRPAMVAEVMAAYLAHADGYYRKRGRRTSEYHGVRSAAGYLNDLYGDTPADEFGPTKLRAVQAKMVADGKARSTANAYTWKIIRAFGWALGREMVRADAVAALEKVGMLQRGRTAATDRPRRKPVRWEHVEATFPHLNAHAGRRAVLVSMLRTHWAVGCRPQDGAGMRAGDLDRRGDVWRWVPGSHKQEHRTTRPLVYLIGPRAQAAIAPHLVGKAGEDRVFVYPPRNKGKRLTPVGRREYGDRVKAACAAAGVPAWTPHQIRHAHATRVAEEFGSIEAAAAAIGDDPETAAAVYVHLDPLERAKRLIALRLG